MLCLAFLVFVEVGLLLFVEVIVAQVFQRFCHTLARILIPVLFELFYGHDTRRKEERRAAVDPR